jgi:hypothetical protein
VFNITFKTPVPGIYDAVLVGRPLIVKGNAVTDEETKASDLQGDSKNIGTVVLYLHAKALTPRLFLDKSVDITFSARFIS